MRKVELKMKSLIFSLTIRFGTISILIQRTVFRENSLDNRNDFADNKSTMN